MVSQRVAFKGTAGCDTLSQYEPLAQTIETGALILHLCIFIIFSVAVLLSSRDRSLARSLFQRTPSR